MSEHKTYEEIRDAIKVASQKIKKGGVYEHFKQKDKYKVVDFCTREEDEELCVIYLKVADPDMIFVRTVKSWLEKKVMEDGSEVERFQLV